MKKLEEPYARYHARFYLDDVYLLLPPKTRNNAYLFLLALNGHQRDNKSDGVINLTVAREIARVMNLKADPLLADLQSVRRDGAPRVVEVVGDEVWLLRYAKWQDTPDEIAESRAKKAAAGSVGGRRSADMRSKTQADASTPAKQEAGSRLPSGSPQLKQKQAEETERERERERESSASDEALGGALPDAVPPPDPLGDDLQFIEAVDLCDYLAASIGGYARRPTVTEAWRNAARLLLTTDRRDAQEARALIDWLATSEWWRPNVLSMPKFREKFDTLRLTKQREGLPRGPASRPGISTSDELRRRAAEERAAEMAAEAR